jgi:transcription antitermination protein NusB
VSSLSARKKARNFVCQALYQWQMTEQDSQQILQQFLEENEGKSFEVNYFTTVFSGVVAEHARLDALFEPLLKARTLKNLTAVELSILRIGTYELAHQLDDLSDAIVISEAVRLAKRFGAKDGYRFVNAVLDRVAQHFNQTG